MRVAIKHLLESALVRTGAARAVRTLHGGRTLILAYHNVVPDDDARTDSHTLHLPKSVFFSQLDEMQETAEVVPLEAVGGPAPRGTRPRVVLTFDDCYRGAIEIAGTELRRRGLPATFFACPGLLEQERFWWDAFPDAALTDDVFGELGGDGARIEERLASRSAVPRTVSRWRQPADLGALEALVARSPELRIGSHTWSHPNLTRLPAERLRFELEAPLRWLRERFESRSEWLACPYGFSSEGVRAAGRELGYQGILEIDGHWVPRRNPDRWRTPRLSVPGGLSSLGFRLRVSGVLKH